MHVILQEISSSAKLVSFDKPSARAVMLLSFKPFAVSGNISGKKLVMDWYTYRTGRGGLIAVEFAHQSPIKKLHRRSMHYLSTCALDGN